MVFLYECWDTMETLLGPSNVFVLLQVLEIL